MRIVVSGGTGFVGRAVVSRLVADGFEDVVVTTRDPARPDPWDGRVRKAQAFAGDAVSLGRAFMRADVVIHCIQFPNHPVEDPSKGRTYLEVDGRGTEVAARVAAAIGVRRFVYMSGAGAGQGRREPWFRAKDMAETAIRATGMEHGILRSSWIYGPGDRTMSRFVAFCRMLPVVPVIGDGKTPVWPAHVEDVARAVAALATREDLKEATLEVGGPDRLTMDDVVRTIQKVLGTRRPILHHPKGLMKLLVRPMALLPNPVLSPAAVEFITTVVEMDPRPAFDVLGFRFRPLEEGLRADLG